MLVSKKVGAFHSPNAKDLVAMQELLEAGKVVPVIDRRYLLGEVAEAFRYMGEGPRAKVVINVAPTDKT